MATKVYQGKRFEGKFATLTDDALTEESGLQIIINDKPFSITMRTPDDDIDLIRGLLHSEGIIRSRKFHPTITIRETKKAITEALLEIPEDQLGEGYTNHRSLLSVSSCGICGKTELDNHSCEEQLNTSDFLFDPLKLEHLFEIMSDKQKAFHTSGGSHAAAAFDENGHMLCLREDIGRHNAVDKVIGHLLMNDLDKKAKFLLVSGRISYEIVIKCFKARIPVLAAVSAPSTLAVDFAKELGITIFGFCRKNRVTCYSNTQRILGKESINEQG